MGYPAITGRAKGAVHRRHDPPRGKATRSSHLKEDLDAIFESTDEGVRELEHAIDKLSEYL